MENELLKATRMYWTKRAQSYSDYNRSELAGEQGEKWKQTR